MREQSVELSRQTVNGLDARLSALSSAQRTAFVSGVVALVESWLETLRQTRLGCHVSSKSATPSQSAVAWSSVDEPWSFSDSMPGAAKLQKYTQNEIKQTLSSYCLLLPLILSCPTDKIFETEIRFNSCHTITKFGKYENKLIK